MVYIGTYLFIGWPTEVALCRNLFFRGDPYEILNLDITKNWGRWDVGAGQK